MTPDRLTPRPVQAKEAGTFDEATHAYAIGGRPVPSVTQVIGRVLPGFSAGEWYLRRGRAVHHGCRLADAGTLDWDSVAPEIIGRIHAWQRFKDESSFQPIIVERPLWSARYRFAGTMDRGLVRGNDVALCDLKSTIEPQVAIQLGGYSLLWRENKRELKAPLPTQAVAVELRDDGTYRTKWLNEHGLRRAEQTFLACLTVYNFKAENNLE